MVQLKKIPQIKFKVDTNTTVFMLMHLINVYGDEMNFNCLILFPDIITKRDIGFLCLYIN